MKLIFFTLVISSALTCNYALNINESDLIGKWYIISAYSEQLDKSYPEGSIQCHYFDLRSNNECKSFNGLRNYKGTWSIEKDTLNLNFPKDTVQLEVLKFNRKIFKVRMEGVVLTLDTTYDHVCEDF